MSDTIYPRDGNDGRRCTIASWCRFVNAGIVKTAITIKLKHQTKRWQYWIIECFNCLHPQPKWTAYKPTELVDVYTDSIYLVTYAAPNAIVLESRKPKRKNNEKTTNWIGNRLTATHWGHMQYYGEWNLRPQCHRIQSEKCKIIGWGTQIFHLNGERMAEREGERGFSIQCALHSLLVTIESSSSDYAFGPSHKMTHSIQSLPYTRTCQLSYNSNFTAMRTPSHCEIHLHVCVVVYCAVQWR